MGRGTQRTYPVFVCYRRTDTLGLAANLHDAVDAGFGPGTVFRDEDDAPWGKPWSKELDAALQSARVLLVLIGPSWLGAADQYSRRRLDKDDDWVRKEIAAGLQRAKNGDLEVIPILLEGASMPPADALPEAIAGLAELQAKALDMREWGAALKTLFARLEAAGLSLRHASAELPAPAPADPLPALRRQLCAQFKNLVTFPGLGAPPIQSVHVELEIGWSYAHDRADHDHGKHAESRLESRTLSPRALLELVPATETGVTGCWVVLGEPGAGKSTMLRHLAHTLADPNLPGTGPIAVYVPLATWSLTTQSPFELVEEGLRASAGDVAAAGLAARLAALAGANGDAGRVWLLLDGLDEVAPDRAARTRERLLALATHFPKARFLVTSREVGYRDLGEPFRTARLKPLDPGMTGRQGKFLSQWLGRAAAAALLARLETRPQLRAMATNPLLLTMLVAVAKQHDDLPRTRVGLYQRALVLLFEKSASQEALRMERPSEARMLLRDLALALQDSPAIAWTRPQLAARLWTRSESSRQVATLLAAFQGPDAFLQQIAERTGVLSPCDGPDAPWRFLHRQFKETLAAEALHAVVEAGGEWASVIGVLDGDTIPRWSETLGLLCGLLPPMPILQRLREANIGATVRALRDVDGAPPLQVIEFLLGTPLAIEPKPKAWEKQVHWDGDDLRDLVATWQRDGHPEIAQVAQRLWQEVRADADTQRLAWMHWALSALGKVDRRRFFAQCGRPVDAAPRLLAVPLPAGSFRMGSPDGERERYGDEGPVRTVTVSAFWLCATVVTNEDYLRFDTRHELRTWPGVSKQDLLRHPVVNVTWWHAYLYCHWLGNGVRLSSEAEWEYACRAGTKTPFSFGSKITVDQVNFNGNHPYAGGEKGAYRHRTVAVGTLPPNRWGLHEMHGNVWEWCQDWSGDYRQAPSNGRPNEDCGSGYRVLRGGRWFDNAGACRSASRNGGPPGIRVDYVGFRPASSSPDCFTTSPPQPGNQTQANQPDSSHARPNQPARSTKERK